MKLLYIVRVITLLFSALCVDGTESSTKLQLINHAGAPIDLYWVNVFNEDLQYPENLQAQNTKPIRNSSDTTGSRDEIVTVRFSDETGLTVHPTTKFDELKSTVEESSKACAKKSGEDFSTCVSAAIAEEMMRTQESKTSMEKYRDLMSERLRNYTCTDPAVESTTPQMSYNFSLAGQQFQVDSLLNMSHAKIWVVNDFVTEEECSILMKHGAPRLKRATVAAEDGSSVVSEHRKAQQASYSFSSFNPQSDPLWSLYMRIMTLTNQHAGYSLQPQGQEEFTIIQYNVADQYTPHCDGTCDGTPHNSGGRVATAVLYCQVAEEGGATTFTKSDIFVKPQRRSATFFSYKGADSNMDEGYTQHSGCPVTKGEKWITTAWMREGVSTSNPWTLYDPSGIPLMEEEAAIKTENFFKKDKVRVAAETKKVISGFEHLFEELTIAVTEHSNLLKIVLAVVAVLICLLHFQFQLPGKSGASKGRRRIPPVGPVDESWIEDKASKIKKSSSSVSVGSPVTGGPTKKGGSALKKK